MDLIGFLHHLLSDMSDQSDSSDMSDTSSLTCWLVDFEGKKKNPGERGGLAGIALCRLDWRMITCSQSLFSRVRILLLDHQCLQSCEGGLS